MCHDCPSFRIPPSFNPKDGVFTHLTEVTKTPFRHTEKEFYLLPLLRKRFPRKTAEELTAFPL
jgi:hypothetical protein